MKLLFSLLLFPVLLAAQTPTVLVKEKRDSVTEVTSLHNQQYYRETTIYNERKEFIQSVCYNRPGVVDEEFCYTLGLNFANTEKLKAGSSYDLAKDTAVVRCTFGQLSTWNWDYDVHPVFSGTVRIVKVEEDEMVIEENIRIVRPNGQILVYKGERIFRRKEED